MPVPELQLIVGILVNLGSGISSWAGVKVALAEMRQKQDSHDESLTKLEKRVDRLEEKYFK